MHHHNKIITVAIVDGQGGGIGKVIIERLKKENLNIRVLALGTNSIATTKMLKGGADEGATGENAIIYNAKEADIIIGVVAIVIANSMLGEMSPRMAQAIGESSALKILIPNDKCNIKIAIPNEITLQQSIDDAVLKVRKYIDYHLNV